MPTARTDGTPLDISELSQTIVERGTCNGADFGTVQDTQFVASPGVSVQFAGLSGGTYCFRARVEDTGGLQSVWSNTASRTIENAPPEGVTITVTVTPTP